MSKLACCILFLMLLPCLALAAERPDYGPGELLLILHEPGALAADPVLTPILNRHGFTDAEHLLPRSERHFRIVSTDPACDILAAREELAATGLFRAVSPNWNYSVLLTPNDPMLYKQWHVTNPISGIGLTEAWDVTTGSEDVVIAILDTGLDWSHPDLSANCWHNPNEIASNGYVDDIYGWDCGQNDADPRPAGVHEAIWDGRDAAGHARPSGVYFARLTAGEKSGSSKLVLVK